jgi:hypothetical protein
LARSGYALCCGGIKGGTEKTVIVLIEVHINFYNVLTVLKREKKEKLRKKH